jgi:hypothetical protein
VGAASGKARQAGFGGLGEEAADGFQQHRDIQRFFKQGADARGDGGEQLVGPGCDHDDGDQRTLAAEALERIPATLTRHIQVEQHQINRLRGSDLQRLEAVAGWNALRESRTESSSSTSKICLGRGFGGGADSAIRVSLLFFMTCSMAAIFVPDGT